MCNKVIYAKFVILDWCCCDTIFSNSINNEIVNIFETKIPLIDCP